jgi:hypothetical protein
MVPGHPKGGADPVHTEIFQLVIAPEESVQNWNVGVGVLFDWVIVVTPSVKLKAKIVGVDATKPGPRGLANVIEPDKPVMPAGSKPKVLENVVSGLPV